MLKVILLILPLLLTSCSTIQSRCTTNGADYVNNPGVRVVSSETVCILFGKGATLKLGEGIEFNPGEDTVIFTLTQDAEGISTGAVSGLGILGGALGLAVSGGNPLGGAAGLAVGEAANAIPDVINGIKDFFGDNDDEEEKETKPEEVKPEEEIKVEPEVVPPPSLPGNKNKWGYEDGKWVYNE